MTNTTFTWRNRNFTITVIDNHYCAIEDKYITNGRCNTKLNGLQMHASKEYEQCIEGVKNEVDMDYYLSIGMSKAEAFCKIFPTMDLEIAKTLFH